MIYCVRVLQMCVNMAQLEVLQLLEGPRAQIGNLLKRIQTDLNHNILSFLLAETVEEGGKLSSRYNHEGMRLGSRQDHIAIMHMVEPPMEEEDGPRKVVFLPKAGAERDEIMSWVSDEVLPCVDVLGSMAEELMNNLEVKVKRLKCPGCSGPLFKPFIFELCGHTQCSMCCVGVAATWATNANTYDTHETVVRQCKHPVCLKQRREDLLKAHPDIILDQVCTRSSEPLAQCHSLLQRVVLPRLDFCSKDLQSELARIQATLTFRADEIMESPFFSR